MNKGDDINHFRVIFESGVICLGDVEQVLKESAKVLCRGVCFSNKITCFVVDGSGIGVEC